LSISFNELIRLPTKTPGNQWKILAMRRRSLGTTRQKGKYISRLRRSQREKREAGHARQRREPKSLVLNYKQENKTKPHTTPTHQHTPSKKKADDAAYGRRNVAANGRRRERRSGRGGLFVSESRHALLASVGTYEAEAKRRAATRSGGDEGGEGPYSTVRYNLT